VSSSFVTGQQKKHDLVFMEKVFYGCMFLFDWYHRLIVGTHCTADEGRSISY
jgi:hypothetical protein